MSFNGVGDDSPFYYSAFDFLYNKKTIVEKKRKMINDDEEENMIMNKKSSIFDTMKPLEKSEIELGIVNDLEKFLFSNKKINMGSYYPIMTFRRIYNFEKGHSEVIVLGYRFGNKTVEDPNEAIDLINKKEILTSYITYDLNDNRIRVYTRKELERSGEGYAPNQRRALLTKFRFKIIGSGLSGRVFGLPTSKKGLEGKFVNPSFDYGFSNRLNNDTFYALIRDENTGKNVKFCISDLQIQLPNIKGYNFPKDKTIKTSSIVKVKGKEGDFIVLQTYINKTSKKLSKNCETRQLDVLHIKNTLTNDTDKVYAKNVKLVL